MIRIAALVFAIFPTLLWGGDITVTHAYVPIGPKSVMVNAAYMDLSNTGTDTRSLIGIKAPRYAMAHLYHSVEQDGVATMSAMHQIDILPGQTVSLKPGGMHVMLMKPNTPVQLGGTVELTLEFADGDVLSVSASVVKPNGSS